MNTQTLKFLNQLKNASLFNKEFINVAHSKNTLRIVKVLYKEGFLQSFKLRICPDHLSQKRYVLVIQLRYFYDKPILKNLKIISSPSRTIYLNSSDIIKFAVTKNSLFFSTNMGILTLLECKKQQIGGVLFFIC